MDRSDFLRHFYRRYEDAPVDQVREDSVEMLSDLILTKSFPAGIRRVREHRALGHRTVLITGALDFVVEPLRAAVRRHRVRLDDGRRDGRYTGQMREAPPTGESRASALYDYADAEGIDLSEAVAYADSASDLPMLEVVGFPVAVNPETRLAAHRPQAGLAGRGLGEGARRRRLAACRSPATVDPRAGAPVKALLFERKPARYAAAAVAGRIVPGRGAVGRARCGWPTSTRPSRRPTDGCGCGPGSPASAAATWPPSTAGRRRYFEPIVSFPFTPGHEVVGDLDDDSRAVLVPDPLVRDPRHRPGRAPAARPARINRCERIAFGHLEPGLQTRLLHRHRRRLVHRS